MKIDQEKATWRSRAAAATQYFAHNGNYSEPPADPVAPKPFWTEIKWVYLDLQRRKCAYCERRPSSWAGDYAIEHFRPKSRVDDWPPRNHPQRATFAFASSGASPTGYYLIAYHPFNYAAACNQCNTRLKRNFFPVGGTRNLTGTDPVALCASEQPYLIYPLGNHDADPKDLISFDGIVPVATAPSGNHDHRRAEVTISIFDLAGREDLRRERYRVIEALIDSLEDEHTHPDSSRRQKARNVIRRAQSRGAEHSSCAKCFVALYRQDPAHARQIGQWATTYLNNTIRRNLPRI